MENTQKNRDDFIRRTVEAFNAQRPTGGRMKLLVAAEGADDVSNDPKAECLVAAIMVDRSCFVSQKPADHDPFLLHHLGDRVGTDIFEMNFGTKRDIRAVALGRSFTFMEKEMKREKAVRLAVQFSILKI